MCCVVGINHVCYILLPALRLLLDQDLVSCVNEIQDAGKAVWSEDNGAPYRLIWPTNVQHLHMNRNNGRAEMNMTTSRYARRACMELQTALAAPTFLMRNSLS